MTHAQTDALVARAVGFLTELRETNTRAWFGAQKARYQSDLAEPSQALLQQLQPHLEASIGAPVTTKLFRPQRDIRFSTDKTPFHEHLHMLWQADDGRGWFFGIAPDYVTAGVGIMGFDKAQLANWRDAVDSLAGEELELMLARLKPRLDPPELRRVPAPFAPDHPRGPLLRRKALVAWTGNPAPPEQPLTDALTAVFDRYAPVQDWLGRFVCG